MKEINLFEKRKTTHFEWCCRYDRLVWEPSRYLLIHGVRRHHDSAFFPHCHQILVLEIRLKEKQMSYHQINRNIQFKIYNLKYIKCKFKVTHCICYLFHFLFFAFILFNLCLILNILNANVIWISVILREIKIDWLIDCKFKL